MPSSPGYVRDYKQEARTESSARRKQRAERHKARRELVKKYGKNKLAGKDVGHKKALSKGGPNTLENLMIQDPHQNQSFSRNSDGSMKSETSRKEKKSKRG